MPAPEACKTAPQARSAESDAGLERHNNQSQELYGDLESSSNHVLPLGADMAASPRASPAASPVSGSE